MRSQMPLMRKRESSDEMYSKLAHISLDRIAWFEVVVLDACQAFFVYMEQEGLDRKTFLSGAVLLSS